MDVVDFGAGEPDFPTPDNIKQAAIRALEQNFTKYTAGGRHRRVEEGRVRTPCRDFGTSYPPAECIITVGGKHAIFNLTQALINPGDEVVIPVPYWVTYKDVVNYAGGKCVFVETDERSGFALTAAMIEPHLTPRTRMVIVNSPSNPSGAVVERGEFEKIFGLDLRARHLPDDRRVLLQVSLRQRAVSRSPRCRARRRPCWWPDRFRRRTP